MLFGNKFHHHRHEPFKCGFFFSLFEASLPARCLLVTCEPADRAVPQEPVVGAGAAAAAAAAAAVATGARRTRQTSPL